MEELRSGRSDLMLAGGVNGSIPSITNMVFTQIGALSPRSEIRPFDAAADGNPLGTVTRTTPRFSKDYPPTLTAHDIGVKDLLDAFYMQGGTREVTLYAITIDPRQPIAMELSESGAKAAQVAVIKILKELKTAASGD